ncbi:MAG: hypothetical protein ABR552_11595, partial [Actinomycetota bacterium]
AGLFLATVLLLLGRAQDAGAPSIGAAPLGATLPGALIVVVSLVDRALTHRLVFAAAIPALLALVWLGHAGIAGVRASGSRAHIGWTVVPGAAAAAIAILPGSALSGITGPSAHALGAPNALGLIAGAMPNGLGITLAIGAAIGLLFIATPAAVRAEPEPELQAGGRRAMPVAWVFGAIALGWLVALVWVGMSRGFL